MSDDYLANLDDMDIIIPLPEKSVMDSGRHRNNAGKCESSTMSRGDVSRKVDEPTDPSIDSKRKRIINFLVMTSKKTINGIPFEFIREIPIREGDITLWGIEE